MREIKIFRKKKKREKRKSGFRINYHSQEGRKRENCCEVLGNDVAKMNGTGETERRNIINHAGDVSSYVQFTFPVLLLLRRQTSLVSLLSDKFDFPSISSSNFLLRGGFFYLLVGF